MVTIIMVDMVFRVVMVIMVIRTDRTNRTHGTDRTDKSERRDSFLAVAITSAFPAIKFKTLDGGPQRRLEGSARGRGGSHGDPAPSKQRPRLGHQQCNGGSSSQQSQASNFLLRTPVQKRGG